MSPAPPVPSRRSGRLAAALAAWLVGAYLLALPGAEPVVAAFAHATGSSANAWSAGSLAGPSSVSTSVTCQPPATSTPVRVGAGTPDAANSSGGDTTAVLTRPAAAQEGDLVVALFVSGDADAPLVNAGTPAFTHAVTDQYNDTISFHVFYRWMPASGEPSSYSFSPPAQRTTGIVLVYRGVDRTTPFDAPGTVFKAGNATPNTTTTAPSVTTTGASRLVLAVQGIRNGTGVANFTSPSGTPVADATTFVDSSSNSSLSGRVGDIAMATAGATGDTSVSHVANSLARIGVQVPIRPAASSGPSTGTVTATWSTAGTSSWAEGYRLERRSGATVLATTTVPGVSSTSGQQTGVPDGAYTYALHAYHRLWRSSEATATVAVECANRVANAGFESGAVTPWSCNGGGSAETTPVRTGSYALRIPQGSKCLQTVPVSAGTTYSFSVWVNNAGGGATVGAERADNGTGLAATTASSTSGTWSKVTVSVPTGTATSIRVFVDNSAGMSAHHVDDAYLG